MEKKSWEMHILASVVLHKGAENSSCVEEKNENLLNYRAQVPGTSVTASDEDGTKVCAF